MSGNQAWDILISCWFVYWLVDNLFLEKKRNIRRADEFAERVGERLKRSDQVVILTQDGRTLIIKDGPGIEQ